MEERMRLGTEGEESTEELIRERRGNVFVETIKIPKGRKWKDLAYSPCCGFPLSGDGLTKTCSKCGKPYAPEVN